MSYKVNLHCNRFAHLDRMQLHYSIGWSLYCEEQPGLILQSNTRDLQMSQYPVLHSKSYQLVCQPVMYDKIIFI